MKKLYCITLLFWSLTAPAQDNIAGSWQGVLSHTSCLFTQNYFNMQLELVPRGNGFVGKVKYYSPYTRIGDSLATTIFEFDFEAEKTGSGTRVRYQRNDESFGRRSNFGYYILGRYNLQLNYSRSSTHEYLTGPYNGSNGGNGIVYLSRKLPNAPPTNDAPLPPNEKLAALRKKLFNKDSTALATAKNAPPTPKEQGQKMPGSDAGSQTGTPNPAGTQNTSARQSPRNNRNKTGEEPAGEEDAISQNTNKSNSRPRSRDKERNSTTTPSEKNNKAGNVPQPADAPVNPLEMAGGFNRDSLVLSQIKLAENLRADLLKRKDINTKTVFLEKDTSVITIKLYDYAEVDDDTVSIFMNSQLIISRLRLNARGQEFTLSRPPGRDSLVLQMMANNLGSIPPNTSVMIIEYEGKKEQFAIESDFSNNATVTFVWRRKE
jgi:hypothetical protein